MEGYVFFLIGYAFCMYGASYMRDDYEGVDFSLLDFDCFQFRGSYLFAFVLMAWSIHLSYLYMNTYVPSVKL